MKQLIAAAAACVLIGIGTKGSAAPRPKLTDVCKGCIASVPPSNEPAPLLVVLHGDWGHTARELHAAWERFAVPRNVAVLALACPEELGCKQSWWQWNGASSWITDQVDRLAARHPIDRERLWIAGWSGGATYIGMRTQELERSFKALVFHGGGIWPSNPTCAERKPLVVMLLGNRNPLHAHALKLRDHYQRCGNPLTTMLLDESDHDGEWRALDQRGGEILDRLAARRQ